MAWGILVVLLVTSGYGTALVSAHESDIIITLQHGADENEVKMKATFQSDCFSSDIPDFKLLKITKTSDTQMDLSVGSCEMNCTCSDKFSQNNIEDQEQDDKEKICSCEKSTSKSGDLPTIKWLLVAVEVVQVLGTCVMAAAVVFVIRRSSSRTAAAAVLKRGSQEQQHGDKNPSYEQSRHNSTPANHKQK